MTGGPWTRRPKEVFFAQEHPPWRQAAVGFTHATALRATIAAQPLRHLLFDLRLSLSG